MNKKMDLKTGLILLGLAGSANAANTYNDIKAKLEANGFTIAPNVMVFDTSYNSTTVDTSKGIPFRKADNPQMDNGKDISFFTFTKDPADSAVFANAVNASYDTLDSNNKPKDQNEPGSLAFQIEEMLRGQAPTTGYNFPDTTDPDAQVSASVDDNKVIFNANSDEQVRFEIERNGSKIYEDTTLGLTKSYTDSNLTNGEYDYKITLTDQAGNKTSEQRTININVPAVGVEEIVGKESKKLNYHKFYNLKGQNKKSNKLLNGVYLNKKGYTRKIK